MGGLADLQNISAIGRRLDDLEKTSLKLKIENDQLKERIVYLEKFSLKEEDKQEIITCAVNRATARG